MDLPKAFTHAHNDKEWFSLLIHSSINKLTITRTPMPIADGSILAEAYF